MNKILNILAFDTLYGGLNWGDRLILHGYISGRGMEVEPTARIKKISEFIRINRWEAPEMKYMKDEVLLYVECPVKLRFMPISQYVKKNPNPLENEKF